MKTLALSAPTLPLRSGSLLAVFALLTLAGCEKPKPVTLTMPVLPPRSVSVSTVTTRDVPVYLDAQGQTTALQSVNVVSQVDGQIVEMPFQQGSMVKKGDKLAVIFQDSYIAAVNKAEGQVNIDKANLKVAQENVERNKLLLPDKQISQQQFDTFQAQVDSLAGQLQVDEADLKNAQINLNYTVITAPIDGMVGTYRINVGNVIKANDLPITTIQTMDPIYVDFSVSETDFPLLRKYFGTNGNNLKVRVTSLSDPNTQAEGNLTILGNAIAGPTGTLSLRATVPNEKLLFWPNQPVDARVLLDTLHDAVVVPEASVMLSQQGEFVFVVGKPTATSNNLPATEMRVVQTGQSQDDGMKVVTSGLKPGEQVVTEGQVFLAPTMPLIIAQLDGKPTAKAAAAAASTGTAGSAPATASGAEAGASSPAASGAPAAASGSSGK